MRAVVIANPASRLFLRGLRVESVVDRLRAAGFDVVARVTSASGEAGVLACDAAAESYDVVVVAGGDGTIREAIDGLAGSDVPLGIIPTGTGNVLRRFLRLPRSVDGACEVIRRGRTQRLDLGRAGGRHFVLHASVGHDANVVRRVPAPMKAALGELAFVGSILSTLVKVQRWRMRVRVDGDTWEGRAWAVIVANSSSYAWKLELLPHARTDDGLLDVAIFDACGVLPFLGLHVRGLLGEHLKSRHVHVFKGTSVEVEADPSAPVQMDGDIVGEAPLRAVVVPSAVSIIVP